MTDSTRSSAPDAGWYADPAGLPRHRWWDGTQWTEHLHDPALEVYGVVPAPVVNAHTPVYTVFLAALLLLPVLSILMSLAVDPRAGFSFGPGSAPVFDPLYLVEQLLVWAVYAASVVLAFLDRRRLIRAGFERPFHWAWTFLSTGVYVIGRSVIVRRRCGRGLAPIWAWAITSVITIIIVTTKIAAVLPDLPSIPA